MGVCLVAEKYRRIDLQMIPRDQWPCALLYFTGSAHFNRSIRLWVRRRRVFSALTRCALFPMSHLVVSLACCTSIRLARMDFPCPKKLLCRA